MYKDVTGDFEIITSLKAAEIAPLSESETEFVNNVYFANRRRSKAELVINIIILAAVLVSMAIWIYHEIKEEVWTEWTPDKGLLLSILESVLTVPLSIAAFVSVIRFQRKDIKSKKGYAGFRGRVLQKEVCHSIVENIKDESRYDYSVKVYIGEKKDRLMVCDIKCTHNTYNKAEIGDELIVLYYKDGTKIGFLPE